MNNPLKDLARAVILENLEGTQQDRVKELQDLEQARQSANRLQDVLYKRGAVALLAQEGGSDFIFLISSLAALIEDAARRLEAVNAYAYSAGDAWQPPDRLCPLVWDDNLGQSADADEDVDAGYVPDGQDEEGDGLAEFSF